MMRDDLVSIIIPVYNGEKYISRCLDSLIRQTYKNIEIIIIDDGSEDNSKKICEEYKIADGRIKIITQKNAGVSTARNNGIKIAKGKYITFVDSDDWVDENFIKALYISIINTSSCIAVCGVARITEGEMISQIEKMDNITKVISRDEAYKMMVLDNNFGGYLWNKMYSASILKKMLKNGELLNKNIHVCEDMLFNSYFLSYCDRITILSHRFYYYFQNTSSVTGNRKFNNKILTILDAYKLIFENYAKYSPNNYDYLVYEYLKIKLNLNYRIKKEKVRIKFSLFDREKWNLMIRSPLIRWNKKLYLIISYSCPFLTSSLKEFIFKIKRWVS